jgi:hypothetical protein
VAKLEWSGVLKEVEEKDSFRLNMTDAQTFTGLMLGLDSEEVRFKPLWTPESLTIHLHSLNAAERLEPPLPSNVHPIMVLSNGDVIAGTTETLKKGILGIAPSTGNPFPLHLSAVRSLVVPGEEEASWIVDPVQLLHQLYPGEAEDAPRLSQEGIHFPGKLAILHALPANAEGYVLRARFTGARNVSFSLRWDSRIRNGVRMGTMFNLAGRGLNVRYRFRRPTPEIRDPHSSPRGAVLGGLRGQSPQTAAGPDRRQEVCDLVNPDWDFDPQMGEFYITGFELGCTVEEFHVVAWDGKDPQPAPESAAGRILSIPLGQGQIPRRRNPNSPERSRTRSS